MHLRRAIKAACAIKGTTISALDAKMYPAKNGKGSGVLFHMTNKDKTKNGPRIDTIEKIAEALDMKASELIALGEE